MSSSSSSVATTATTDTATIHAASNATYEISPPRGTVTVVEPHPPTKR